MTAERICKLIEDRKEELFSLLSSYVKINSENFDTDGNEEALAEEISRQCRALGLEAETYSPMELENFDAHPDYMPGRSLEHRPNVTARWRGEEDLDELMLMGHLDTVPIGDLASWEGDPLSGEIRDGKIYGRGACDDKYALATAVFIIKLLKEEGFLPKKNLLFTGYCDEERGGSHGALASALRYPANRTVNMDGRKHQIWHCASGGGEIRYLFHAKGTVDSAGVVAAGIPVVLDAMKAFGKRREAELATNPYYSGTNIPKTSLRYMQVKAGNMGQDLGKGEVLFVFYTDKTKEEIYRELSELEEVLAARLAPLGIVGDGFAPLTRFFHYTACDPRDQAILDFSDAMQEAVGERPLVCGSCLSDLSVIGKYSGGSAFAYGCGRDFSLPGGPHQPNEYMDCESLVEFAKIIAAYVVKVLG